MPKPSPKPRPLFPTLSFTGNNGPGMLYIKLIGNCRGFQNALVWLDVFEIAENGNNSHQGPKVAFSIGRE